MSVYVKNNEWLERAMFFMEVFVAGFVFWLAVLWHRRETEILRVPISSSSPPDEGQSQDR
jgi:hypothetical protein